MALPNFITDGLDEILHRADIGLKPIEGTMQKTFDFVLEKANEATGEMQGLTGLNLDNTKEFAGNVKDTFTTLFGNLSEEGQKFFATEEEKLIKIKHKAVQGIYNFQTDVAGGVGAIAFTYGQTWDDEVVPTYENAFDQMANTSYEGGQTAAESFNDGFQDGFESSFPDGLDTWAGGTYGTQQEGTYDWNGQTYINNGAEWGWTDYVNGLPVWHPASSQGFYDWLAQQQTALTGGFIDAMEGVMPSFKMGGVVPIRAHAGEVVIPTQESAVLITMV